MVVMLVKTTKSGTQGMRSFREDPAEKMAKSRTRRATGSVYRPKLGPVSPVPSAVGARRQRKSG